MKSIRWIVVVLCAFIVILAIGCIFFKGKEVSPEMHQAISNYILDKNANSYLQTDKQFEAHKIFGTSEKDGFVTVYLWSVYEGFNLETGTTEQSGHSLPAVVKLKKSGLDFKVVGYKEPKDGSMLEGSLKKMFPLKYYFSVRQGDKNHKELKLEINRKVEKWLGE